MLRVGRFRFFFFSNAGLDPPHVQLKAGRDQAKFWLDPIALAADYGFRARELSEIERLVSEHHQLIMEAWNEPLSLHSSGGSEKSSQAYRPTTALAKTLTLDADMLHVHLADGRVVSAPLVWHPLLAATPEQRERYEIGGGVGPPTT